MKSPAVALPERDMRKKLEQARHVYVANIVYSVKPYRVTLERETKPDPRRRVQTLKTSE